MSIRTKLMSAIIAVVLSISTLIVGVVALKNVNFNVQGSIGFTAKGVNATVSYDSLENCQFADGTAEPTPIVFSTHNEVTNQENAKNSWKGLSLKFNETTTFPYVAKLNFTVKNDSTVANEYVLVGVESVGKNIQVSPNNVTVSPDDTKTFSIEFTLNSNVDTTINFNLDFNLTLSSEEIRPFLVEIKNDLGYPYMTMGQMSDGTEIVWRYVGYKSGDTFVWSRTPVVGQTAVFVQETFIVNKAFYKDSSSHSEAGWGNINPNDYATSDIRAYLNSETFISGYGLNGDVNYSKIISRSLTDLYNEIGWDIANEKVETLPLPTSSDSSNPIPSGPDKFWLMSAKEAYNLLGQHEATINIPSIEGWQDNELKWNPMLTELGYTFGIRTPFWDIPEYVPAIGLAGRQEEEVTFRRAVRAAFLIQI